MSLQTDLAYHPQENPSKRTWWVMGSIAAVIGAFAWAVSQAPGRSEFSKDNPGSWVWVEGIGDDGQPFARWIWHGLGGYETPKPPEPPPGWTP